jgi:LEA14-like dessication related protein
MKTFFSYNKLLSLHLFKIGNIVYQAEGLKSMKINNGRITNKSFYLVTVIKISGNISKLRTSEKKRMI